MPIRAFVFDAYGTLFDVHAAIARHRDAAGPEADRFSEIWRAKQLEYAWMLSAAGHYVGFLDADRARARLCVRALSVGRPRAAPGPARLPTSSSMHFPMRAAALTALQSEGLEDRDPVERQSAHAAMAR